MVQYDNTTLVVRHLPHELSCEEKIDLMKFFGADEVKCLSSNYKKSSLVFAKFKSEQLAEGVMKKLHQKDILGQLVSVEFARGRQTLESIQTDEKQFDEISSETKPATRNLQEQFLQKLHSWSNQLDLNHPPPAHLKYSYPPPSLHVLKNICKALLKIPKLYTQVLHLMNKMNLPCPFVEEYIIKDESIDHIEEDDLVKNKNSSDESEIESEIESDALTLNEQAVKRKFTDKMGIKSKKKRPRKFIPPSQPKIKSVDKPLITPDQVFETPKIDHGTKKTIELNLPSNLSVTNKGTEFFTEPEDTQGFDLLERKIIVSSKDHQTMDGRQETEEDKNVIAISEEELSSNRIPSKDFHLLPVFKNYQAGLPSCRLYIKNLAKTVEIKDLNFIYKRYLIDKVEEQGTMFDIRLLQEGRMKGQAFVTLQSVSLAEKALKETNGFILKGKAMVVQFARSSKPK